MTARSLLRATVLLLLASWMIPGAHAATVQSFLPRGTVKAVRQVTARFSAPMVAFGDSRLPAAFDVECPAPGRARWADDRSWVYDFEADLPAGLSCVFRVRPELRALDGGAVTGTRAYRFDTGGPAIRSTYPQEGAEQIDADQAFILALDTAAQMQSITEHAACSVENIAERIPVHVITGGERDSILAQRRGLGYAYFRILWKSGEDSIERVNTRALQDAERDLVVLRCQRSLPPATPVQLIWGRGIVSSSGIATTQNQTLAFRTRPAFSLRMECERVNANAPCLPMRPVRVVFSAPVPRDRARVMLRDDVGNHFAPQPPESANTQSVEEIVFPGPFPEAAALTLSIDPRLLDDAGRAPENAARFPLTVRFDEYPPLIKFSGNFGILESVTGGVLPVTLRNVETPVVARRLDIEEPAGDLPGRTLRVEDDGQIARWLQRVDKAVEPRGEYVNASAQPDAQPQWRERTGADSIFAASEPVALFAVPKPQGDKALEVVGIPLKKRGFYVVETSSLRLGAALLGPRQRRFVATTALVTNLAVHFKWGRESSRVWVTRLDTGATVPAAQVNISGFCNGASAWSGETDKDGIARITTSLGAPHGSSSCEYGAQPLMVSARTGDDFSFTLSAWANGIAPYDFDLPTGNEDSAYVAHSVLDRSLFRAGETVSMKHFLRQRVGTGFRIPDAQQRPVQMWVTHSGSDQRFVLPVSFDAQGIAESRWEIPKDAKLGEYQISLGWSSDERRRFHTSRFRVEQFRLPTMKATVQGPGQPQVRPGSVSLDLFVGYLSGGGAGNAAIKLRTLMEPRVLSFPDYADFSFVGEEIREGVSDPNEGDDVFAYYASRFGAYSRAGLSEGGGKAAQEQALQLDANGAARALVKDLAPVTRASSLLAELEYQDANGERLTSAARVALWSANLVAGVRAEGWAGSKDKLRVQGVALDLSGKPVRGQALTVELFQRQSFSYRKRMVGGFYSYEYKVEVKKLPAVCTGRTDVHGLLACELAPGVTGEVLMRARATDSAGNAALATSTAWLVGDEEWWFNPGDADRMDLLPEQKEYQPGQMARFQVRMPFRKAVALVTVEREGVIESFVTQLSGRDPVVQVPIRGEYSPNVFVSVLAVRGRVPDKSSWFASVTGQSELPRNLVTPTALVDLAKPAYRLGTARIRVGWAANRLDVQASSAQQTYKVRDKAIVEVTVNRADGSALPAGAEVALAVVDEALLELSPNSSWSLLEEMMNERGIEVWTSTAQMQVVGKRHFGRKAVPAGGGGGRAPARELFDTLLLWQPRAVLDANGRTRVEVPLNDSLTAFRVVAIASAGAGTFGTGQTTLRTTQDLMLHSGLAPLVREGDRYAAVFTLRNASTRAMTVDVSAKYADPAHADAAVSLPTQSVELAAGASRELSWDAQAPQDANSLQWEIAAKERGRQDGDALNLRQQVIAAFPVRTLQATLAQLTPGFTLPVARPADVLAGRGGIQIALRAKLGDGLLSVREYMAAYDYICTEQRLSQAIALRDRAMWSGHMARLPAYLDRDGLVRYFPGEYLQGSDTLTAYVLAIAHEAGWEIPAGVRARMLKGLQGFVAGRVIRDSALPTADLAIRKLAAIEALSRYEAAQPAMLTSITLQPNLWPTSAVIDWLNVLKRVPQVKDAVRLTAQAQQVLRARMNFQGTVLSFSTERSDALWWLMISGDVNATRAVLALLDDKDFREDMPRFVRATLLRQRRGHWDTTTANAWGTLAMEKFSAAFESVPVTGNTSVRLGAPAGSFPWRPATNPPIMTLAWPAQAATLALHHEGTGKPWVIVQSRAAVPLRAPLFTGYSIKRTLSAIEQRTPGVWTAGDVARVSISVDAQTDMSWVVVDDPVPAGASILGGGLGRDSSILAAGEQREGHVFPAYEERRFDAFRAYYSFVPKGSWTVEYTVRFNSAGTFLLPATHVEAMYAPEMLGELPNAALEVRAAP
ncbi:MAG: MG2 domain-containing protein [Steroidobacteraceae bacterium]